MDGFLQWQHEDKYVVQHQTLECCNISELNWVIISNATCVQWYLTVAGTVMIDDSRSIVCVKFGHLPSSRTVELKQKLPVTYT